MNTTNLANQQTNMPRQDHTYLAQTQQMSRPNYQNPTSIAQLQAMYGTRPSGGEVRSAPVYQPPQQQTQMQMQRQMDNFQPPQQQQQPPQQYFRPQQYQQDPYMNYMRNQQQAMQQQAVQQGGIRQLQQADILRQQQAAQQGARLVAQREAAAPAPNYSAPDWQAG
jgi:hypothetical protein